MNQLSHGQKINIPTSVVRSVSFQKIRQGSLSSRNSKIQHSQNNQKNVHPSPSPPINLSLCQRLMSNKLLVNNNSNNNRLAQNKSNAFYNNDKSTLIRKQIEQKEMRECTFRPKVNKSTHPQRTVQQFVDQQLAYKRYKDDKINQMRQMIQAKIDKQNTFQPNLVNNNKSQQSKRSIGQVHERLYEQFTKRQELKQNQIPLSVEKRPSSKFSTQNKIQTYSRKGSQKSIVDSCAVSKKNTGTNNDLSQFNSSVPFASQCSKQNTQTNQLDRQNTNRKQNSRANSCQSIKSHKGLKITKYMNVQQVCDKKLQGKMKMFDNRQKQRQRQQKKLNPKNKQLYIKKILRQISCILIQLNISDPNLNYMQMSLILEKMNFLDEQTNINDRKYSYQIWQMLQGDLYESCPLPNLIRIIFCLLGCHDFLIIQECLSSFMPEVCAKRLVLTQKQSKNIKVNFQQLALNRLRKGQHISGQPKIQQYSFKPFVSKSSSEMAEKYRQRVIQQSEQLLNKNLIDFQINQSGQVDHVDLLMLDDKRKQLKMRMKRQQQQRQKKRIEDQAMQGQRAKKVKNRPDLKLNGQCQNGNPRFQHLYELGKYNIRTKKQRGEQQQKIPKQCTFHPNISKSKQGSNKTLSRQRQQWEHQNSLQTSYRGQQIKDFDKSIFRMYEGRRIREESHSQHNTSKLNTDRSSQQHRSHHQQDNTPFLYLNICMEGCDDIKVPVFHSDNMRTITHKVKVLMGLQNADDSRLQEILKLQIMPTLQQIGMNVDLQ